MLKLRPFNNSDAAVILSWFKDEESFRKWSSTQYDSYPITPETMIEAYSSALTTDTLFPMTAFDDEGIAGHMILRFPNPSDRSLLRFGFIVVNPAKRGQGTGKEMLALARKYAHDFLGVKTISLGVFDNNPAARRCYLSSGFLPVPGAKRPPEKIMGEDWYITEMYMKDTDRPYLIPVLESERLILRPLVMEDLPAIYKWASDPEVARFLLYSQWKSEEDGRGWLGGLYMQPKQYEYGFVWKETGELIGSGGAYWHDDTKEWVIGYNLRRDFWGRGITPEAMTTILNYLKKNYEVHKVSANFANENAKSGRVMEKLGMSYESDMEYSKFDGSMTFKGKKYSMTF